MKQPRVNKVAEKRAADPHRGLIEILGFVAAADQASICLHLDGEGRLSLEIAAEDVVEFVDPPDDETPTSFYVRPEAVLVTRVTGRVRASDLDSSIAPPSGPGGGCGCEGPDERMPTARAQQSPIRPGGGLGSSSLDCYTSCHRKYRECLGLFPSEKEEKRCKARLQACRLACQLWGDIGVIVV